jgi:flagellar motor component MotA
VDTFSLWRLFGIEKHHQLLLKWMVITAVAVFTFFMATTMGLVQEVLKVDRTYISAAITLIYVATSLHCMVRTTFVSRQLNIAAESANMIAAAPREFALDGDRVALANGKTLPPGVLSGHVRDLVVKGRATPGRVDQTLLLKAFEDKLFGAQAIGDFIAETMLKLGLLGTVIGFIFMLAPLTNVQTIDVGQMREVLASMSGGMAVALYTTLCGLVGGILLKLQYYFLQGGTEELVSMVTEITEVYVVPALESDEMEVARAAE